jgi:LmbE family N-acetylglucosaminyl deacetylase
VRRGRGEPLVTARVDAGIKGDMVGYRWGERVARCTRKRKGRRWSWAGLVLAVTVAAARSASPAAAPQAPLPELRVPPKLRLLVVAPHPDDESLGAGGLMQQVLDNGGRVHVLFMTSGDGYPEAVALATGHRQPTAVDYRGFGELRRAEALVALEHFHILPLSVTFLGFPDGGLQEIWRRGPHVPAYESPFTRGDRPPYPEAFNPNARYTSRELIGQIARLVALADPDWIVLPTPIDTHPDHCATFTFVLAALKSLANEPGGDSKIPDRLLTYLVHDGRWPPPPSGSGALPAPAVSFPPAPWHSLPLDREQVDAKIGALESHLTQAAVMELLFRALARSNEIFGVIERPQLAQLKPGEPPCAPEIVSHGVPGTVPIAAPTPLPPASGAMPSASPQAKRVSLR